MASGTSIFTLMGSIMIDNDKADASIQKTEGLAGKLGKGLGSVGKVGLAIGKGALVAGGAIAGIAALAVKDLAETESIMAQLDAVIKSTGGAAGVTREQAMGLADALEKTTKFSAESTMEAQNLLLTFTNIGKDVFPTATKTALDMATALGGDAASQSVALGKALNDPIAGISALGRVGVTFTEEQKNVIKSLVETGDVAGAQTVILEELNKEFGGSAEAAGNTFAGKLEIAKNALGQVTEGIALGLMPHLQNFLDWVISKMPEIEEFSKKTFETVTKVVETTIAVFRDYLIPIFVTIYEWVQENWPTISAIIKAAFDTIKFVWNNVLSPVLGLLWDTLKGVVSWVSENWPTISAAFKTVFDAIKFVWDKVLSPVLIFIVEGMKKVVDFVANYFSGMQKTVENVFGGIGKAVGAVTDTFRFLIDKIEDAYDWLTKWNKKEVAKKTPSYSNFGGISGSFAVGTRYLPKDMLLQAHEGEMIVPKSENPYANSSGQILSSARENKNNITVNINGANVMDDYGVDRLMDRVMDRIAVLGVR